MFDKLTLVESRYDELMTKLGSVAVQSDPSEFKKASKALAELGSPTYGFAPLRLDPDVPFLSLFHGHDERVPVAALRFGLPVLHEVVARYVLHA